MLHLYTMSLVTLVPLDCPLPSIAPTRHTSLKIAALTLITGGKGALTQQAHGEFIVSSETIRLPNTQQVHGE